MSRIVALVICAIVAVPASVSPAALDTRSLLRSASQLSGLRQRRPVPILAIPSARYDALLLRAASREYPDSLRRTDALLYARLGLSGATALSSAKQRSRAWYDTRKRRLLLRRAPKAGRSSMIQELVRALVDQNFDLRRVAGLRIRDRDRAIAAAGIVDGTAALASGLRAAPARGTPLERFLAIESSASVGPGRALAAELRYLGGNAALASVLRSLPETTEQLLHIDKLLERERALATPLPSRVGDTALNTSETFGELDVRALLSAFGVPNAAIVAAGWGGGRLARYVSPQGETVAALVLRWDSPEDADEWREAIPRYVAAAFPDARGGDCPPLDRCWEGTSDIVSGTLGETSVLVSGPGAEVVAAALLVS